MVMGCGWVRQSGRRVEQKVCRDGDNEMSDNGASTASILGSRLDHRLRSGVFIFIGRQNVCWHGGGCIIVKKNSGWDKLTWG